MLSKITNFFAQLNEQSEAQTISLDLACAVLLCEVMRADEQTTSEEITKIKELIQQLLSLTAQETDEIVNQAITQSEESSDLYTYTSLINQHYDVPQKITLITMLWQLAIADGEVAAIEQHIIRKIADLLHLRHSEYIQAKNALNHE